MTIRHYVAGVLILLCLAAAAVGQSTFATITGAVTDPSGAVLTGATIEATEVSRNYTFKAQTTEAGVYTLANLPEGTYRIVARAAGFQEFRAEDIIVTARDNRRVDVQMSLQGVGQTVEVTGGATLIETDTARVANTMNREVMRALPLTLRRAWDYFTMTPQVERTSGWSIRLGGTGNNQSDATIDGTSIATAFSNPVGPLLDRTELVQEMRIDISMGSAEQATLGQITMTSRSGSNEFHGTLADYYSTPAFRARNPFNNARSTGRSHQFIFSAGGPVYIPKVYDGRNKTFFFHTTEIASGSRRNVQINRTVPLEMWRRGDFSNLTTPILDPFNNNTPFPNNIIPQNRINPVSRAYQDRFIVAPNFGNTGAFATNNFRVNRFYPFVHQPTMTTRLDHRISEKQFIFGRLTTVRWNFNDPDTNLPTIEDQVLNHRYMDTMTLAHTYSIRANLLNEFRFGWTGERNPTKSPVIGNQLVSELGLRGLAAGIPDEVTGVHRVSFQNLGLSNISTRQDCDPCGTNNVYNYIDNVTLFRGSHSFKMGTNLRYSTNRDLRQAETLFGRSTFTNRFTGHTYADFLLGVPSEMERAFPTIENYRTRWTHGYYFTDEWKLLPNLTLTLGLRWDAQLPWREANDRISMFDISTGNIVVPDTAIDKVSPLMPRGYVGVVAASSAGYNARTIIKPDMNNWQPRFGFAYRPWGNDTVLRGGFGVAYNQVPRGLTTVGVPFVVGEPTFVNPIESPLVWPNAFPSSGSGGPSTVSIPAGSNADIQIARVMQYTITAEHQRWGWGLQAGYTGTGTRQGVYTRNINQPVADERLFVDKPRMFPQYPEIMHAENGAGHQYHALTLQAMRRYSKGLHVQAYYTLARDIGDLEDGQSPEDAYNRLRERAVWERLPTHRFSSNVMYDLPFGRGRPFMNNGNKFIDAI
ncbi:MAG TPA: TonB-dependent receptor, partial [Bryobacteraceae bacterium]|nr:TonB-dependent receptor [Bryobacteraceae bacterium]